MTSINKSSKILILSDSDLYGGASIAGYNLHQSLRANGFQSFMIVNNKISNDPTVIQKENSAKKKWIRNLIEGTWNFPFSYRLGILARKMNLNFNEWYSSSLIERYNVKPSNFFPVLKFKPDIIHFNTGGGSNIFDIRDIKILSHYSKVVFSLHDLWILSKPPPLVSYKNIQHAINYKFHQINQSKINFIAHSKWVYNNFLQVKETQGSPIDHIKYSININKFKSRNKTQIRKKLKIPKNVFVIMTTAVGILSNPFKDFKTLYNAYIKILHEQKNFLLIVVGDKESNLESRKFSKKFIFINPSPQSEELIEYYSCADLYIQSSNIETWGLAISEALSCGLPVIASSVGAIPEQIKGFHRGNTNDPFNFYSINKANGLLFEKNNKESLYEMIMWMFLNKDKMKLLGKNARSFAKKELDINNSVYKYIDYYNSL
ncbi:MAG: glycosyltransferase [Candidatus Neomarinimicrobiota bacterium]